MAEYTGAYEGYFPEDFPGYTLEQLEDYWLQFNALDLDGSGAVSTDNLQAVLLALDVELTPTGVGSMIEEACVITGQETEGKLTFANYVKILSYADEAKHHNEAVDAAEEAAELGIEDAEVRDTTALLTPEAVASNKLARSSLAEPSSDEVAEAASKWRSPALVSVLALASIRINQNMKIAEDEAVLAGAPAPVSVKQSLKMVVSIKEKEESFKTRLARFKKADAKAAVAKPIKLGDEQIHKATMKNKLAAFEAAKKGAEDPVVFKKTWKYKSHSVYGGKRGFFDKDTGNELGPKEAQRLSALLRQ